MKKLVLLLFAGVLTIGVLGACSKRQDSSTANDGTKKVLVMGTSADYKPYEYVDTAKGTQPIGFDVDVANYIGKELGYTIQVKDSDFSGLLASMQAGKVDFVMAGMTPTDDRKKNADFTDIYYTAKNVVISKNGTIQKMDDLKGKTVGVQTGSIQETKAKDLQKQTDFKIEGRDRVPDLFQELKDGRVDAIIIESTVAKGYLAQLPDLKGVDIPEAADESGSAIALPKGSKYTADFNKVIEKMKQNGEMDKLIKKWFDGTVQ